MTTKNKMVSPQDAEELAQRAIQGYLNACHIQSVEDAGNALMKLISVSGLVMCATVGQSDAVARLQGTTDYIAKPHLAGGWKMEKAN